MPLSFHIQYGAITCVVVMKDADGESKCFRFINITSTPISNKILNNNFLSTWSQKTHQ